ncbi:MAG: hypothetical protein PHG27_08050 [Massilibacteroides sp.]|nr:hypothetical protein [Massilibacteroides sp.]MDD3062526.1 hypothetical protein [Massilibacteroides sp.]MDD4115529.1 hypothetical protein [Massilibacteroides sp.]MDD4660328.1 hypothetical protein [Massilibacteroides sp.]
MRTLVITLILFCCIIQFGFGQNIVCNFMRFELVPIQESDTSAVGLKYRINVNMDLSVSNMSDDTVVLKTNVKISQGLGPENLIANRKDKTCIIPLPSWVENRVQEQPFMDTQFLYILIPDKEDSNLLVSYDVIGTGLFFYIQQLNYPDVFVYPFDYEYIYPIGIPINKIEVTAPDSMKIFYSHKKGTNMNEEITLSFINKKYFQEENLKIKDIKINIFTPDSLVNDTSLIQRKKELQTYINTLSPYTTKKEEIDILLLNWRDEKNRNAFGRVFGNLCICDYKFAANSLFHEVLHIIFPSKVEAFTKGEYFIKESIIEWLTLYLSQRLDKIDMTLKLGDQNLYDTHINDITTWKLIYNIGPMILQKIAKNEQVGEERLAKVIIDFLQEREGRITDYVDFISYLEKYVPFEIAQELDSIVKGLL